MGSQFGLKRKARRSISLPVSVTPLSQMIASGNNVVLGHVVQVVQVSRVVQDLSPQHKGCIATDQQIESVGLFLASFAGTRGLAGTQGTPNEKGKSLEKQKIAVS